MLEQGNVRSCTLGFLGSLILIFAAYFAASMHELPRWAIDLSISGIAVLQAWLFLFFYLRLGKESKPHWGTMVFLFMILVTLLLVVGSMWIMYHLNYNLMPKELSNNKMNHLTCAKSPKIDDQEWGCISMDTTPFLIVDFRWIWRGEMVHFIVRQFLKNHRNVYTPRGPKW